ncbi:hypothetical protein ABK040_008112 [Willaertia magna]
MSQPPVLMDDVFSIIFPFVLNTKETKPFAFSSQVLSFALVCKKWFTLIYKSLRQQLNFLEENVFDFNEIKDKQLIPFHLSILPTFDILKDHNEVIDTGDSDYTGYNFVQGALIYIFNYTSACPSFMLNYLKKEFTKVNKNSIANNETNEFKRHFISQFIKPLSLEYKNQDDEPIVIHKNYGLTFHYNKNLALQFIEDYKSILKSYAAFYDSNTNQHVTIDIWLPNIIPKWMKNVQLTFNKILSGKDFVGEEINEEGRTVVDEEQFKEWWEKNIYFYFEGEPFDCSDLFNTTYFIFAKNGIGFIYNYGASD